MKVHKTVNIKKGDTDFYLSWYNMDLLVYSTCTQWFAMENKIYETHRQSDNTSNYYYRFLGGSLYVRVFFLFW